MIYWPTKTPGAAIDYGADWGPTLSKLGDPTIVSSVWSLISGDVTIGVSGISGGAQETLVRISGGTDGTEAIVKNTVTLSDGQILDEKAFLKIRA